MKIKLVLLLFFLLLQPGIYASRNLPEKVAGSSLNYEPQEYSNEYSSDDLNSYGEWIEIPGYGRVWRPNVDAQWQPFSDGHWVFDGNDWVWDSYEPYGPIVYHYGNWEYVSNYQWVWIPNHAQWSPAIVVWVYYGDQIAWAPRPRQGHSFGEPWEHRRHHRWMVVQNHDFINDHVYKYRVANVARDRDVRRNPIIRTPPPVAYVQKNVPQPIPVRHDIIRNGKIPPNTLHEKHPVPIERNPAITPKVPGKPVRDPAKNNTKPQPLPPVRNSANGKNGGKTDVVPVTPAKTPSPVIRNRPAGNTAPTQVKPLPPVKKPADDRGRGNADVAPNITPKAPPTVIRKPAAVAPAAAKPPVRATRNSPPVVTKAPPQQHVQSPPKVNRPVQVRTQQQPAVRKAPPVQDKKEKRPNEK